MNHELHNKIGVTFKITDGPQVFLTYIPITEPAPGNVDDSIELRSKDGRHEFSRIKSIEYVRKSGCGELYSVCLEAPIIPDFDEFMDGGFEVKPTRDSYSGPTALP